MHTDDSLRRADISYISTPLPDTAVMWSVSGRSVALTYVALHHDVCMYASYGKWGNDMIVVGVS